MSKLAWHQVVRLVIVTSKHELHLLARRYVVAGVQNSTPHSGGRKFDR